MISVVIVAYAARADVETCLRSLRDGGARAPHEVIVFDNGSSDGTSEMVKAEFPEVRLFRSDRNLGLAAGVNEAVGHAAGAMVCLLDADTVIEGGAVDALAAVLDARPDVGVVAGRMIGANGEIQETARRFPRPLNGLFGRQTWLSRVFPGNPITAAYLDRSHIDDREPFEVEWVAAACMMFRRDLFERLGGFDRDYFVYWVDADWCWRVRQAGRSVFCVPAARIHHIEQNRTGKRKSGRAIRSFHEGAYLLYRKHYVQSAWHPFLWIARLGLAVRCQLILAVNAMRR